MGSLIRVAALLAMTAVVAAQPADLRARVGAYVEAHQKQIVGELLELLAIPNVAADRPNIRRNAEHLHGAAGAARASPRRSSRRPAIRWSTAR